MKRSAMAFIFAIGMVLGLQPLKAQALFNMTHWHDVLHFMAHDLVREQRAGTMAGNNCLLVLLATGHPDFAVCNIGGTAKNFADTQFVTCIDITEQAMVGSSAGSWTSSTCIQYPVGGATDATFAQGAYDATCTGTVSQLSDTSAHLKGGNCTLLNHP